VQSGAVTKGDQRPHPSIYLTCVAYALLTGLAVHRHEPWADEAQSWLLGRDTSLGELWSHLLHYEGTPGLWQSCLHFLIRLGLPYSGYGYVSASLSLAAVILLLRYAPLPLFIRILLPFTYFLCYQYAVVARSYALIAPLLVGIAVIYPNAIRKPVLTTALLCLLAGVSVHGFLISVCIWATLNGPSLLEWRRLESRERRTFALQALTYFAVLLVLLICAWPARDVAFAEHRGLSNLYLLADVTKAGLAGAFTGYWITSLALIALSAPFLWRGGGWLFFLLVNLALFLFGTLVYAQLWHFGILFLAWLFAIWISAAKTPVTTPTVLALIIAIGVQFYWTATAIGYDWDHAYSGSLAAAQYLKETGLPAGGLYAIGYPTVAVQPYFPANIYSNYHGGGYWDWSKRNRAGDPAALFASDRRELVLVGYKNLSEKQHWAGLLALLGYGVTQHFEGRTFWQTSVFELESYDLYGNEFPSRAASSVSMADRSEAAQLLNGFYDIEGKSRWTARNFTVMLKRLGGSNPQDAQLTLKLYIPDSQIQKLGAITLSAEVGGQELPARTFSQSSEYTYSARVPAGALRSGFAVVNFRLDKSSGGRNGDARDLGVVVTEVGFATPSPAQ